MDYPQQTNSSIPEYFSQAGGIDRKQAYQNEEPSVDEQMLAMKKIMTEQQTKLELLTSKLSQDDSLDHHVTLVNHDHLGTFPSKLYRILELADAQKFGASSVAVAWCFQGRAFEIVDEETFMAEIVPQFFKQTKIRSFYR